jgi:hypothetical protein
MDTAVECVCCQRIDVIKAKCKEVAESGMGLEPGCITQHPGFRSVCLDVWVLQAVYNEYRQQYGDIEKNLFELVPFLMYFIVYIVYLQTEQCILFESLKL